jgi:4-diphosphocytidyl-2-C-methyl-D-erythritol kinase
MATPLRLSAPAKVNLVLRILGKRADGYHELETLFERIDLADELTFQIRPSGLALTCDNPALSCGEDNLVLKAARLLQHTFQMTQGASIHLTKRIPIAAGLGGGSSDAATTLMGLSRLWELEIPTEQLHALAAHLGSDVPFFLLQQPFAIGKGRGERLEPLPEPYPTLWHVVVTPPVTLSTPEVYAGFDAKKSALTPPQPLESSTPQDIRRSVGPAEAEEKLGQGLTGGASSISMCVHALRSGPAIAGLAKGSWNDLEPEAIRRCPVIHDIRILLRKGGCVAAITSGSGPSVVGLCHDAAAANAAAEWIRAHGNPDWFVAVTKTESASRVERLRAFDRTS